jgi:hypothetical protein
MEVAGGAIDWEAVVNAAADYALEEDCNIIFI